MFYTNVHFGCTERSFVQTRFVINSFCDGAQYNVVSLDGSLGCMRMWWVIWVGDMRLVLGFGQRLVKSMSGSGKGCRFR